MKVVTTVQKERLTRKNYYTRSFESIHYCIETIGIDFVNIEIIIFYEKLRLNFERLLEKYIATSPRGVRSFIVLIKIYGIF